MFQLILLQHFSHFFHIFSGFDCFAPVIFNGFSFVKYLKLSVFTSSKQNTPTCVFSLNSLVACYIPFTPTNNIEILCLFFFLPAPLPVPSHLTVQYQAVFSFSAPPPADFLVCHACPFSPESKVLTETTGREHHVAQSLHFTHTHFHTQRECSPPQCWNFAVCVTKWWMVLQ